MNAFVHLLSLALLTPLAQTEGPKTLPMVQRQGLPGGMVARLGLRPFAVSGLTDCLAFTPDGQRLVTTGSDCILRVWSVPDGVLLRSTTYGTNAICPAESLSISRDGKFAIVGRTCAPLGPSVQSFDLSDGSVVHQVGDRNLHALANIPSSDGKLLHVVSAAGECKTFVLATQNLEKSHDLKAKFRSATLSPGGKYLFGVGGGKGLLADVATGKVLAAFTTTKNSWAAGYPSVFSPDGTKLAYLTEDFKIALVESATGKTARTLDILPSKYGQFGVPCPIDFSPDGKAIALATFNNVTLFTLDGNALQKFQHGLGGTIVRLAFSPTGDALVACTGSAEVGLWNPKTGARLSPQSEGFLTSATLSRDGEKVYAQHSDGSLGVWNLQTGKRELRLWRKHSSRGTPWPFYPSRVELSHDEKTLAAWVQGEKAIDVWKLEDRKLYRTVPTKNSYTYPAPFGLAPDGKSIAVARMNSIDVHNLALDIVSHSFASPPQAGFDRLYCVQFSSDGGTVAGSSPPRISLWDLKSRQKSDLIAEPHQFRGDLTFSANGRALVTGMSNRLGVWEMETGKLRRLAPETHGVSCAALTPDGLGVVVATTDGQLKLKDLLTGDDVTIFPCTAAPREVHLSADGSKMLTVHNDGSTCVWKMPDLASIVREKLKELPKTAEALWEELAEPDPARAYPAWYAFRVQPELALPFLRKHLKKPLEKNPNAEDVQKMIAGLESADFKTREKASKDLDLLGKGAMPLLEAALRKTKSAESRTRLVQLLQRNRSSEEVSQLRLVRATELLEYYANDEAQKLLGELVDGEPSAPQTIAARQVLAAVRRRTGPK